MSLNKLHVVAGLSGFDRGPIGLSAYKERIGNIEIPSHFAAEALQRAQRDCEILATLLKDQPREMVTLLEAITHHRFDEANQMIIDLGLSEGGLQAEGGGLYWLLIIAVCLYATDAY
jgi:hypothetical protein